MKRIVIALIIVALVGGLAGAAWLYSNHRNNGNGKLVLYGNVDIRQVQLAFNAAERIAQMKVREGEHVKKGQVLATLDTDRLQHNVELQRAQVAAQQQVVKRLEAGSRPEEIAKAEAEVEAAHIDADNAERTYQRQKQLSEQNFISSQQADNAHAAANAAQARYQSAQASLKLAQLGPRREDIAAARAALQASRAALEVAKKALADATLSAPDDAIIQERILEPGDMASPQRPVYTLALTNPLWVRTYVQEKDLGRVKPGLLAEVSTDSFPGKRYRAWVGYISPSAEFTPKSVETTEVRSSLVYQLRVFVCNPQDELRLGMPATVTLQLEQPPVSEGDPCANP